MNAHLYFKQERKFVSLCFLRMFEVQVAPAKNLFNCRFLFDVTSILHCRKCSKEVIRSFAICALRKISQPSQRFLSFFFSPLIYDSNLPPSRIFTKKKREEIFTDFVTF